MIQKLSKPVQKKQKLRAFTLVEIMFVTVIIGIVGIILTSFMMDSARSMLWSVNKAKITNDFRKFTLQINQDALNASNAYLYLSFNINDSNDRSDRQASGLSGDCLILVHTDPFPAINSQRYYQRIVAYYREPTSTENADESRPVFRREIRFDTPVNSTNNDDGNNFFETFLNSQRNNLSEPEVVLELSRGLIDNRLFRAETNETFIINGEIIHGENSQIITNTYNLTISTRG